MALSTCSHPGWVLTIRGLPGSLDTCGSSTCSFSVVFVGTYMCELGYSGLICGVKIVCTGVTFGYLTCSLDLSCIWVSSSDMNIADSDCWVGGLSGELKGPLISFGGAWVDCCLFWSSSRRMPSLFRCISWLTCSGFFSEDLNGVPISLFVLGCRGLKFFRLGGYAVEAGPSAACYSNYRLFTFSEEAWYP